MTPLHARAGFSLVETVVAAVLLSVAVLSVAAGGAAALRALASAERVQGAVIAGRAVLDSLAHRPVAGAGTVDRPPFRVGWYAADTAGLVRIVVVVRTVAGSDSVLALSVLAAPPPRLR